MKTTAAITNHKYQDNAYGVCDVCGLLSYDFPHTTTERDQIACPHCGDGLDSARALAAHSVKRHRCHSCGGYGGHTPECATR